MHLLGRTIDKKNIKVRLVGCDVNEREKEKGNMINEKQLEYNE